MFKHALREFKDNLVATYSVVETRGSALKYKDLIGNFLHVMETVCAREGSTLSITMGVNAFRGFMDEFMSQHETDKARTKRKKDKKRKVTIITATTYKFNHLCGFCLPINRVVSP